MSNNPTISIVIPSLNSSKTIGSCLDGVLHLDYPKDRIHVIVMDHGSTDGTEDIVHSRGVEFHSAPSAKSIGELRNRGVEISSDGLIAFLDSDCIPLPDWLSSAVDTLDKHNINVTGYDYLISDDPTWIEKLWYDMRKLDGQRENIVIPAGNFIIRRSTYLEVGGFDVNFIVGEDTDICMRLIENNHRIIASPSIKVVHLNEPKTLGQLFRKQVWHGKETFKLLLRHFNFQVAKIPVISILYFAGILASLVLLILGHSALAGLILILVVVCFPFVLSIYKFLLGKHKNILGGMLLYIIYFFARSFSIIRYNLFGDIFKMIGRLFMRSGKREAI